MVLAIIFLHACVCMRSQDCSSLKSCRAFAVHLAMRRSRGYRRAGPSHRDVDPRIRAEIDKSVSKVRQQVLERDDEDDHDDYDALMGVATAADRKTSERQVSLVVGEDFGCYQCLRVIKADVVVPAALRVTVEQWEGWRDALGGPECWQEVRLCCGDCAVPGLEQAAASRKRTREKNELRACEQARRLRARSANAAVDSFATKLQSLSINKLKAMCAANAMTKTGVKHQLIERLVGVWLFGSLPCCPACKGRCLELQYAGDDLMPTTIQCKRMRGQGVRCGFGRRLAAESTREVLIAPLRDSPAGDLASLGVAFER